MATDLLFAYGTLMSGCPLHRLLTHRADYVGTGQVTARLLDLGAYPAAVSDPHGVIHGEIYRVTDPALWITLDSAEGPQYYREQVAVRNSSGRQVHAFIYWYTGPLDRGIPIPGGDYRAHAPARSIHT